MSEDSHFIITMQKIVPILFLGLILIRPNNVCSQVSAGSILWLRSDRGAIVQNGHLIRWQDQSGNHNDAIQTNSGNQPDLIDTAYNGKPSIRFNGWNYLQSLSIFPVDHDYSVSIVVKINNFANLNNLVSGNGHAIWFDSSAYPRILHGTFYRQDFATIPVWPTGASVVTVLYSEADQQAIAYVNGEFADSSYIQSNGDSTLYIGSYIGGYFLQGEIQEVLLYDRELAPDERVNLDSYILERYNIAHGNPNPKPDSTFTSLPAPLQLFPRDANDSASVPIGGTIYSMGLDSIYVAEFKNGDQIARMSEALHYNDGIASFAFAPRIHAELSEYTFEVHIKAGLHDSLMARRDSIVCGDAFLIDGQSNAIFGYDNPTYENEFCRTFGIDYSEDHRDTTWELSLALKWGDANSAGAWGQRIQRNLVEHEHIPSCCINGGVSATAIGDHLRNDTDKYSLRTIYGRQLYRATKAGLEQGVNVLFWDQGELNYAAGYYDQFHQLFSSWKEDYPNLKKVYLTQNRPNYCGWGNIDLRDVQRAMGDSIPEVEPIATAALPYQDGCHYYDPGLDAKGDRLFASFARDFYHATDTADLRSANAMGAYYTSPAHTTLAVIFSPPTVRLSSTPDTTVVGVLETLKDYLYLDDPSTHVNSVRFDMDTLFLDLNKSSTAQSIGYLPDQYYNNNDTLIYEGPWIVNSRGLGAFLFHHLAISNQLLGVDRGTGEDTTIYFFPDPVHDHLTLDVGQLSAPVEVAIVREDGIVLLQRTIPFSGGPTVDINLASVPSGSYIVNIQSAKGRRTGKIVVEH